MLDDLHHVAIIVSDYRRSRRFYTDVLGLRIIAETYRPERDSWKLDLQVSAASRVQIELFSFPAPPPRRSYPEACGARHLCFAVRDLDACVERLQAAGVAVEPVRVDALTGERFIFFTDPDGLPIELKEPPSLDAAAARTPD